MVRGVRDHEQMEIVEATLVLRKGHAITRQELIAHCRQRLSEYKLPRRIIFFRNPSRRDDRQAQKDLGCGPGALRSFAQKLSILHTVART